MKNSLKCYEKVNLLLVIVIIQLVIGIPMCKEISVLKEKLNTMESNQNEFIFYEDGVEKARITRSIEALLVDTDDLTFLASGAFNISAKEGAYYGGEELATKEWVKSQEYHNEQVELIEESVMLEGKALYFSYVDEICKLYDNVDPFIIKSMMFHESSYKPDAESTNKFVDEKDVGLMQISMYWHKDRAEKLGITDFYDPYSNILLGVDFVSELSDTYEDINLVLMLYNMQWTTAFELYNEGQISNYAQSVIGMADGLRRE